MLRTSIKLLKLSYLSPNLSRCCSTEATESSNSPQLMPSLEFLKEAQRRGISERLSRIIAEIEVIKEFSHELPLYLNDSQWDFLLHVRDFGEREEFLRNIYFSEISKDRREQQNESEKFQNSKILAEKEKKFAAGEMVYGRGFYDYLDLRGTDFRRQINTLHGSRLIAQERIDEKMPQLIVDCRYLQRNSEKNIAKYVSQVKPLYDQNWFYPHPFRISICNLLMDDFVARLVRSKWAFALGASPKIAATMDTNFPSFGLTEFEDLEEIMPMEDSEEVVKHEFVPKITSKGLKSVLDQNIAPEEVAVISKTATRYIDGDITRFKAFVLHTTMEQNGVWQSPTTAASNDGFLAYRLPIEKYVKWHQGFKDLSLSVRAEILKLVYTGEADWREAFLQKIPPKHLEKKQYQTPEQIMIEESRQNKVRVMKDAIKELHYRKMETSPPQKQQNYDPSQKRVRHHRYSREERNRMRQMEANQ
uniref:SAM-dependent MTase TRM10-type domain-containing protein n=1 Tax=Panagrolaimus sp. ES5 TaxID=591445 RepID=A0AC34F0X2_9BILA